MKKGLVIDNEKVFDSYMKMAMDEAFLLKSVELDMPILRFYEWNNLAIALGYFQSYSQEVNEEHIKRDNIEIFRRLTGGGAVLKDYQGEVNYSFVIPEKMITSDIYESHSQINKAIISGLNELGFDAYQEGINDIFLDGKKISGNAQTRLKGGVLQHGTILLDFDVEKMHYYLNIPKEKLSKAVGTLREKEEIEKDEVIHAIKEGFREEFNIDFKREVVPIDVMEDALSLYQKYSSSDWIYKR